MLLAVAFVALSAGPASAKPHHAGSNRTGTAHAGTTESRPAPAKTATFGIGAATARALDSRAVLNYDASPGSTLLDHVALVNLSTRPLTLSVYAADAVNGANGAIGYQPKADPGSDESRWITLQTPRGTPTVTVAGRTTRIVPVTIRIPVGAAPGDHLAGIIASITSKVTGRRSEKVNFEQRVALRTFVRVSGVAHPALQIQNLHTTYHGTANPFGHGSATVTYTVHNAGNIDLGGQQRVSLGGLLGATGSVPQLAAVPLLLPGNSYPVSVSIPDVAPGIHLHAAVTITPLAVAGAAAAVIRPASAATGTWAIPWTLLVVALVLAGIAVAWLRRRAQLTARSNPRHRPRPRPGPRPGTELVASGKA